MLFPLVNATTVALLVSIPLVPPSDTTRGLEDAAPPAEVTTLAAPASPTLSGHWQLRWDDEIGDTLVGEVKQCTVRLREIDGQLAGEFVGPVAGHQRNAILSGDVFRQAGGTLLSLRQRETGYACSYQVHWQATELDRALAVGVWHDSEGRNGNFSLLKLQ